MKLLTEMDLLLAVKDISEDNVKKYLPYLNKIFDKYEINTKLRLAHYIAQVGHESLNFSKCVEMGNDKYFLMYESGQVAKNLGNTQPGDGKKFKGRGLIQITGRWNYTACGKYLGIDLVNKPELLEVPEYAVESSGWFWKLHNVNKYADLDNIELVTKAINGGLNGLDDRKKRLVNSRLMADMFFS